MRPNEGSSSNVFEVEISPSGFFKDLSVMVVEGRVPELSNVGRRAGIHSWPLSHNSSKKCCSANVDKEMCDLVSMTRAKISSLLPTSRFAIDVFVTPETIDDSSYSKKQTRVSLEKCSNKRNTVLVEKWRIELKEKGDIEHVSVSMALQAVRSFLHFSQLSAWWNCYQGTFPADVYYRISFEEQVNFIAAPVAHHFPSVEVSKTEAVHITTYSLPRMNLHELKFLWNQKKNILTFDGGGVSHPTKNGKDYHDENGVLPFTMYSNSVSFSKLSSDSMNHEYQFGKRKDTNIDEYYSSHNYLRTTNCQTTSYVGEKHLKLDWREPKPEVVETTTNDTLEAKQSTEKLTKSQYSLSALLENDGFTANLLPSTAEINGVNIEDLFQDFVLNTSTDVLSDEDGDEDDDDSFNSRNSEEVTNTYENADCLFEQERITPPRTMTSLTTADCNKSFIPRIRSKSVSPHFAARYKDENQNITLKSKPTAARKLAMEEKRLAPIAAQRVAGTIPIFHAKTGLPISSSPAPMKKPRKISECSCGSSLSRSSSSDDLKPTAYGLSKSAPPSTGLLGNFEESVLKGRIPVNGTLEGFRGELSASGAFCSKHITYPVKVQYFKISDDDAPSPYLGHINLRSKKMKKKRYRVPRKGTIQLAIFNPNNTVVKVFVVLYDFDDMPPSTKTFVRQRMVSTRKHENSFVDIQTVHYLVHLSFMSSLNSHVYLHSDIRIIFPQQAPDRRLITITDSPSNPKYTPITLLRKSQKDYGNEIEAPT